MAHVEPPLLEPEIADLVQGLTVAAMVGATIGEAAHVGDDVHDHLAHARELDAIHGGLVHRVTAHEAGLLDIACSQLVGLWWPGLQAVLGVGRDDVERLRADRSTGLVSRLDDDASTPQDRRLALPMTAEEARIADFALRVASWLAAGTADALPFRDLLDRLVTGTPGAELRGALGLAGAPGVATFGNRTRRSTVRRRGALAAGVAAVLALGLVLSQAVWPGARTEVPPTIAAGQSATTTTEPAVVALRRRPLGGDVAAAPIDPTVSFAAPDTVAPTSVPPVTTPVVPSITTPVVPSTATSGPTADRAAPNPAARRAPVAPRSRAVAATAATPREVAPATPSATPPVSTAAPTTTLGTVPAPPTAATATVCPGFSVPLSAGLVRATIAVDLLFRLRRPPTGAEIDTTLGIWQRINGAPPANISGQPSVCWRLGATIRQATDAELRLGGIPLP